MLVVEDTATNEVVQFFVFDTVMHLGDIQLGEQAVTFDPSRAMAYFKSVEDHLMAVAAKDPNAFRYLPRRIYSYLMKAPILANLCEGMLNGCAMSWLVDQFILSPIVGIGDKELTKPHQERNITRVRNWAFTSNHSARFYIAQDLRGESGDEPGWVCLLRARDLANALDGPHRNDVLEHITRGTPIFIEATTVAEIDLILKWLVRLKQVRVEAPHIVIHPRAHDECLDGICRLLELPHTKVTTSGATVASLSYIVKHLKKVRGEQWSTGIVFASSYPETQTGDGVTRILAYLLSNELSATQADLQRVLGGNVYSLLPPIPSFHRIALNENCVIAEGALGKTALNELVRMMQVLSSMKQRHPIALGFMCAADGSRMDLNTISMTSKERTSNSASAIMLRIERDGTLKLSGWRSTFAKSLTKRRSDIAATLVRASTTSGPLLDTPAHLPIFGEAALRSLQVPNAVDILAALRFEVTRTGHEQGVVMLSPQDMRATGADDGDLVMLLDPSSGSWWVTATRSDKLTNPKTVKMSLSDAQLLGFTRTIDVDIIRYQERIVDLERTTFAYSSKGAMTLGETSSQVHLHHNEIQSELMETLVGSGTRLFPRSVGSVIAFRLAHSVPSVSLGEIASLKGTSINLRPSQSLADINLIVCLAMQPTMETRDCRVLTPYWMRDMMSEMKHDSPLAGDLFDRVDAPVTRRQLAILMALYAIHLVSKNRSDGKLGVIMTGGTPHKFSIQKGDHVQNHVEFSQDMESGEVMTSLHLTLLDCLVQRGEPGGMDDAYRMVSEMVEDFGSDKATLVLLITDTLGYARPETEQFLSAIMQHEQFRMCILGLDRFIQDISSSHIPLGMNTKARYVGEFALQDFDDFVLSSIDELAPDRGQV